MATMIPNVNPDSIENPGERLFYEAAMGLPRSYTVFYSYKYRQNDTFSDYQLKEADFVIVHPALGYLVVEVKGGSILYEDGIWFALKGDRRTPLRKNPVEQAKNAMYAVLRQYKEKAKTTQFPLKIRLAVCFPDCSEMAGTLPDGLEPASVLLFKDLERLEDRILQVFNATKKRQEREAVNLLIHKVLSPSFKVFARLDSQIEMFHQASRRILTEEQERILDETELDKRKIFFGDAGTGKTFLAMEKARRLASSGKKVLITCFNRNLGLYFKRELPAGVTSFNFHDFLLHTLRESGQEFPVLEDGRELSVFFDETLPSLAFDYFMDLPQEQKYDALVVDEGQDFKEEWFSCLESMLKDDGEMFIFADPHQSLFNAETDILHKMPVSKHRLTRNLRNTETITQWLSRLLPPTNAKSQLKGGLPVSLFPWNTPEEEVKVVERELGRLVSQGIGPGRILVLSPNVRKKSSLAKIERIRDWPVGDLHDTRPNCIRFCTIRSFKGLEADIVFLVGIKGGTQACTDADIYVGASRARFLLYIFHHADLEMGAKQ